MDQGIDNFHLPLRYATIGFAICRMSTENSKFYSERDHVSTGPANYGLKGDQGGTFFVKTAKGCPVPTMTSWICLWCERPNQNRCFYLWRIRQRAEHLRSAPFKGAEGDYDRSLFTIYPFGQNLQGHAQGRDNRQMPRTWHERFVKPAWILAANAALLIQIVPKAASAGPAATSPVVYASRAVFGLDGDETGALPYQQCVPFTRSTSGIKLYGDALRWWDQAAGHYARGHKPLVGAVMSFQPYHAMTLGHVATISRIIDDRTVLLRHANWSPIDGRRGKVELDVRAVDVSTENDWSEVRVWFAPIGDLGATHWPINGFIYNHKPSPDERIFQHSHHRPTTIIHFAQTVDQARLINADFLAGIEAEGGANISDQIRLKASSASAGRKEMAAHVQLPRAAPAAHANARPAVRSDPIGRIIASRIGHNKS
jgi:surface antigen